MSSLSSLPWTRRLRGAADILAGLTVITGFTLLLAGQVGEGSFEPFFHFSYLTNQTSYSNIVVLLAGGFLAFTKPQDTLAYATVRAIFVAYAAVVELSITRFCESPTILVFTTKSPTWQSRFIWFSTGSSAIIGRGLAGTPSG